MRPARGALREALLLCVALAGCTANRTRPTPEPVTVIQPAVIPAPVPMPTPPSLPAAPLPPSDAAVLESLDPDIWQDLLELDPDPALDPGSPED